MDDEGRLQIGGTITAEVDLADLKGADNRTLTDLYNQIGTRASEATLLGIKTQTDKLAFDASNFLRIALASDEVAIAKESTLSSFKGQAYDSVNDRYKVNAEVVANPSNLDVALSTRASESTLSSLSGKFPSAVALADNLSNPTTTLVGAPLLGFDGTYWRRVRVNTSGYLLCVLG